MWEKKKSRLLGKNEDHRVRSQNEQNEELAKNGTMWTVPSDNFSSGKRQK